MRRLTRMLRAAALAGAVALTWPTLSVPAADAATATFPVVQDCSPFADFYASWDELPHDLYADGTRWVPQGLAYDPAHDWLLVSYYDGRDGVATADKYPSLLAVTRLDGSVIKTLSFNLADVDRGGHAGGLAVGRGNLYVASTEHGPRVTRIPLRKIAAAADGATLDDFPTVTVAAASYASFADGRLYVGDFENNVVYSYPTNTAGAVLTGTVTQDPTPTLVQGLAVTDDAYLFSRSYGRTRLSYLTVVDRASGASTDHVLPNMLEGITWAPDPGHAGTDLYTLFESGSAAYGPEDNGGASTCRTHQLWHRPADEIL